MWDKQAWIYGMALLGWETLLLVGCGGSVTCGDGTLGVDGRCETQPTCAPGMVWVGGQCQAMRATGGTGGVETNPGGRGGMNTVGNAGATTGMGANSGLGGSPSTGGGNSAGIGTGGGGGIDTRTPVCSTVNTLSGTNPIVATFDDWPPGAVSYYQDPVSGWTGGGYAYLDQGATWVSWGVDTGGEGGTHNALHVHTDRAISDVGLGLWMNCTDLSAYTGITVWVKGTPAPVEVSLSGVMVTSVSDPRYSGGTCASSPSGCSARYKITSLTTDWQHYAIKWGDFSLTGVAAPLDVNAVNGVNFEMAGSGVLDLWIDQFGFTSN